jgi:hypothetical protein
MDYKSSLKDEIKLTNKNIGHSKDTAKGLNNYDLPDLNVYLNEDEVGNINYLNKQSNKLEYLGHELKDPMSMNLRNLINLWATSNLDVFIDLVQMFSNLGKYSKYFNDIDNTKQWYNGISKIIADIIIIFTKKQRGIYIGITLVLLSFMLFLINITS